MKTHRLTTAQVAFLVGTRAALAGGVGLLISGKLSRSMQRRVGTALVAVGVLTTIPAARILLGR